MNEGFITLPSNTITNYSDNTTSTFRIDLAQPLEVYGNYEIAIVEAIYKQSWFVHVGEIYFNYNKLKTNLNYIKFDVLFYDGETNAEFILRINAELKKNLMIYLYNLRHEVFNLIDLSDEKNKLDLNKYPLYKYNTEGHANNNSVISDIKNSEVEYKNCPKFDYRLKRLYIEFKHINQAIQLRGDIIKILKLEYDGSEFNSDYKELNFNAQKDLFSIMISSENSKATGHNLLGQMFIYSDIGAYQFVGSSKMPLLRQLVIGYKGVGEMLVSTFEMPHYVLINKDEVLSIQIKIRDIHGNKVLFDNSNFTIKLHYRLRKL